MSDRPYARLYLDLVDDAKFAGIYEDDHHFAAYCRLLMIAEGSWPASAHRPSGRIARPASFAALVERTLVDQRDGDRYRIHGLDKEREARAARARASVSMRRDRSHNDRSTTVVRPYIDSSAGESTSRDETRRDETSTTSRDGLPHIDSRAASLLEGLTGRTLRQAGDRNLTEYDRQIEDHGLPAVIAACHKAAKALPPRPTARQLVWSARTILEPFGDPAAIRRAGLDADAEAEQAKRAARLQADVMARRIEAWRHTGKWDAGWGPQPEGEVS